MTTTLTQAYARVRGFLDDLTTSTSNQRWTDALIDTALRTTSVEALRAACKYGTDLFTISTNFTTATDGSVSLTSVKPLKIVRVQIVQGDERYDVTPARISDVRRHAARVETIVISYVPSPVFPALPGDPFVFGSGVVDVPEIEALMCALAASELKMLEGSENKGLERRKAELEQRVANLQEQPTWISYNASGAGGLGRCGLSPYSWAVLSPHTLQLVQT